MTKKEISQKIEELKTQLRGKHGELAVTKSGRVICDKESGILVIKALKLVRLIFTLEKSR